MIVNFYPAEYGFNPDSVSTPKESTLTWHRIVEAMKFAFAKRSGLGDPDMESQTFKDEIDEVELLYVVVSVFFLSVFPLFLGLMKFQCSKSIRTSLYN